MECLQNRIDSFKKSRRVKNTSKPSSSVSVKWPHPPYPKFIATPETLAEAGFYWDPSFEDRDNVTCFVCEKQLSDWEAEDDPFDIHWNKCGDRCCWAIVRCGLKGDINAQGGYTFSDKLRHPTSKAMERARFETFSVGTGWKHGEDKNHGANSRKMARAGFVYTPNEVGDDLATCLYCNLALDGWIATDDPIILNHVTIRQEHRQRQQDQPGPCPLFEASEPPPKPSSRAQSARPSSKQPASKNTRSASSSQYPDTVQPLKTYDGDTDQSDAPTNRRSTRTAANLAKGSRASKVARSQSRSELRDVAEDAEDVGFEEDSAPRTGRSKAKKSLAPTTKKAKSRSKSVAPAAPSDEGEEEVQEVKPPRTSKLAKSQSRAESRDVADDDEDVAPRTGRSKGKKSLAVTTKKARSRSKSVAPAATAPSDEEEDKKEEFVPPRNRSKVKGKGKAVVEDDPEVEEVTMNKPTRQRSTAQGKPQIKTEDEPVTTVLKKSTRGRAPSPVEDDDEDVTPIVKKPTRARAPSPVVDDDDDDATPIIKKPPRTRAPPSVEDDDEDVTPTVKKPTRPKPPSRTKPPRTSRMKVKGSEPEPESEEVIDAIEEQEEESKAPKRRLKPSASRMKVKEPEPEPEPEPQSEEVVDVTEEVEEEERKALKGRAKIPASRMKVEEPQPQPGSEKDDEKDKKARVPLKSQAKTAVPRKPSRTQPKATPAPAEETDDEEVASPPPPLEENKSIASTHDKGGSGASRKVSATVKSKTVTSGKSTPVTYDNEENLEDQSDEPLPPKPVEQKKPVTSTHAQGGSGMSRKASAATKPKTVSGKSTPVSSYDEENLKDCFDEPIPSQPAAKKPISSSTASAKPKTSQMQAKVKAPTALSHSGSLSTDAADEIDVLEELLPQSSSTTSMTSKQLGKMKSKASTVSQPPEETDEDVNVVLPRQDFAAKKPSLPQTSKARHVDTEKELEEEMEPLIIPKRGAKPSKPSSQPVMKPVEVDVDVSMEPTASSRKVVKDTASRLVEKGRKLSKDAVVLSGVKERKASILKVVEISTDEEGGDDEQPDQDIPSHESSSMAGPSASQPREISAKVHQKTFEQPLADLSEPTPSHTAIPPQHSTAVMEALKEDSEITTEPEAEPLVETQAAEQVVDEAPPPQTPPRTTASTAAPVLDPFPMPALSKVPFTRVQNLTDAELDMTVEEWIRYQMETEYDKFRRDGEREIGRFKKRAEEVRSVIEGL
ncbi:hypothetical protein H0H92_003323 [Tricholoma furcatifolium]|nr:hypothetical protein H0H92_003323 [Tricholoma furcatifolium]